jgi:hemerythrin-like domain-containing protein
LAAAIDAEATMRMLQVLVDEHHGFSVMLDVLDAMAGRLLEGKPVPAEMVSGVIDFFEHVTDGHHRQEEELLFPLMAQHGIGADQTVVNALLTQHDAGRAYTRKMRADAVGLVAGVPDASQQLARHARGFVELIREHIRIEDSYFYTLASEILTNAERATMAEAFTLARAHRVPENQRGRYRAMLAEYPGIVEAWKR